MGKTINGKTIEQILDELQEDFPPESIEKRDYDGIYYIGVDAYRERLNTVIGIGHYNELYEPVEIIRAQDTYATKTKCRLEILDDDFNVILIKESAGGSNIAFPKVDEKDKDGKSIKVPLTTTNSIPNDLDSACQDAFKRICKKQLLMGKRQLDIAKAGTAYTITLTQEFKEYNGHLFGEGKMKGQIYKIAIFKNQAETFKSSYGIPEKGKSITFYGKVGKDNRQHDQLVFEKVYREEREVKSKFHETEKTNEPLGEPEKTNKNMEMEEQDASKEKEPPKIESGQFKSKTNIADRKAGGKYIYACRRNDQKPVPIVFLDEQTEKDSKWNDFVEKTAMKTEIQFRIRYTEKNGTCYFIGFC